MPGWTAVVNGRAVEVEHDGLGFMVLKPECDDCQITISYDGGMELRATSLASFLVMLLGLIVLAKGSIRRTREVVQG